MKKAAIYARASMEETDKRYSLISQIKACKNYAELHDLEVITTITDDYSETSWDRNGEMFLFRNKRSMFDRPGLDELRHKITQKTIDAVIVFTLERLTNSIFQWARIHNELDNSEIELHYVDFGISKGTSEAWLQEAMLMCHIDFDIDKIIESKLSEVEIGGK